MQEDVEAAESGHAKRTAPKGAATEKVPEELADEGDDGEEGSVAGGGLKWFEYGEGHYALAMREEKNALLTATRMLLYVSTLACVGNLCTFCKRVLCMRVDVCVCHSSLMRRSEAVRSNLVRGKLWRLWAEASVAKDDDEEEEEEEENGDHKHLTGTDGNTCAVCEPMCQATALAWHVMTLVCERQLCVWLVNTHRTTPPLTPISSQQP